MSRTRWWFHARYFTSLATAIKAMLSSVASPRRIQLRQFGVTQYTLIPQGEQERADSNRRKEHFVTALQGRQCIMGPFKPFASFNFVLASVIRSQSNPHSSQLRVLLHCFCNSSSISGNQTRVESPEGIWINAQV